MTTSVSLQFNTKAMMNEVMIRPTFCIRIVARSTTTVRSKVASLSNRDASMELVFSVLSNHPISFLRMAARRYRSNLDKTKNSRSID